MFFKEFNHFFRDPVPDDSSSGTSDFNKDNEVYEPDDCYCESATSLVSVDLSDIDHLYFWSPVRFVSDDENVSSISIENNGSRLFVTDKIGLCPFYTLYDSDIFKDIHETYKADIIPVLPRDLDTLSDEEDITIKLISPEAKGMSGEFNLYVYEVDKSSINNIDLDTQYKTDNLYLIPKSNGDIRIYTEPIKVSHVKYNIIAENNTHNVFESGQFAKYADGVDLDEARKPVISNEIGKIRSKEELEKFYSSLKRELEQGETIQEAKLPSKKRNALDDSDFALVYTDANGKKIRKYPIHDEAHCKAAAHMFPRGVPLKYQGTVARKILRRAHKFGIDTSGWKNLNKFKESD
jgi:hypothetical protein